MSKLFSLFAILCALCLQCAHGSYKVAVQGGIVQAGKLVSLNINFGTPVNSFSLGQLQIWGASQLSLSGASLKMVNSSFYNLTGISIPVGNYTLKIANTPPTLSCPVLSPKSAVSPITVGNGTPASCTEAALIAAINQTNQNHGGFINFSCGPNLVSIKLTKTLNILSTVNSPITNTTLNGNGLIELDGQGVNRILNITGPDWRYSNPIVTIQGIRFVNGKSSDVANTTSTTKSGGAIYGTGASLTIINCDFYGNNGPSTGQDVAGGGVFLTGSTYLKVSGSVFWSNSASNGGAIGALGPWVDIMGSVLLANQATGFNGNPGNGGNGGGLSVDGNGNTVSICGAQVGWNKANQFGAGMFRVGYTYSDAVNIQKSNWIGNQQVQSTGFAGGMYIQGPLSFSLSDSSISYNNATGNSGLFLTTLRANITDVTFANNTARTGLGSAISFSSVNGTFNHLSVAYNYAGAFGTLNGAGVNILLANSVISNNTEGNIWVPLSCNLNSLFQDGGANYQWPVSRLSGQLDANCSNTVIKQDPKLNPIDPSNLGCYGPKVTFQSGSPATGDGARCTNVPAFTPLTYWVTNYRPVDRSVWFQFAVSSTSVTWGASSQQSG